jgi:hypothetical protein
MGFEISYLTCEILMEHSFGNGIKKERRKNPNNPESLEE